MLSILLAAAMIPAPQWHLVWSDEFDKPGAPNPDKWTYEEGYIRNNEKQFYTKRPENARIEDGRLVIEARKDNWNGHEVTSASLTTEGKAAWKYGKIEVRAKLPTGRGTWPAIWMLGTNIRQVGWPKCGEIDIMENVGYDPARVHATIHTDAYNHNKKTHKAGDILLDKPWEKFYTYSVEWHPTHMDFFVDEKKIFTFQKESDNVDVWPFDKEHYLIINLAIGGGWGGQKGIDEAIFPARYEIEYVRVYERK
jgi:beta-glucanase (GH16 family)